MSVCVVIALDLYLLIIPCLFVPRSNRQHSKSHQNIFDSAKTADISEIKRAYRKLSSKLHPDKNPDDPTAEQKFRRLVGIYEVLKNSELRAKSSNSSRKKEKLKADKQERKRRLVHEQTILREVVKEAGQSTLNSVLTDIPNIETESSDEDSKSEAKDPVYREWSEVDRDNLVRAVIRYPGGVPGRWQRISESLGRSVPDVIRKAKCMSKELMSISQKNINLDEIPTFETNVNNFCGESNSEQSNNQSDESDEEQYSKKRLRKRLLRRKEPCVVNQTNGETQLNANNDLSSDVKDEATLKSTEIKPIKSNDGWTKVEQQQLEVAIRSIGKGTPERWDRITECIPTRTKAEVMAHVKYLSTLVQQKH
ncbi:unnamed protein product [Schistosoma mattheei]|uniref:J domain-containing protein n=1 Tax=Schistosoma mattheei TaxID=31246 RepID=A0AA85B796_9TREM|nr:unnamed protein product [Schistosoma mattheei]